MHSHSNCHSPSAASESGRDYIPSELVGVAGFEPAASSSRTKDGTQASGTLPSLTWESIPQYPPAPPSKTQALDARVTHGRAG